MSSGSVSLAITPSFSVLILARNEPFNSECLIDVLPRWIEEKKNLCSRSQTITKSDIKELKWS